MGDPFEALSKKFGQHADLTLDKIKEVEEKTAENAAFTQDLAQQFSSLGRRGGFDFGSSGSETWGEQFVANNQLKSFAEDRSRPGRFRMEVKATLTNGPDSAGAMVRPTRDRDITTMSRQQPTIRDLLSVVEVSGNSVEYVNQTQRPTAAAPVAETALKPESAMVLELVTVQTRVIAHWIPASRQILEDAPQLRDLIDTELRDGLREAEELQILAGDGVSPNLHGLIPQATAYVDPLALAGPTQIDTIATAILQNSLANEPADGVVLHPSDFMAMRLLKDNDGKYILGAPGSEVAPRLFGLPVVQTTAMPKGDFLVGRFAAAATIYDRWLPSVTVSTEHADFFTRNMVAILAEERLALAVKKPRALTYGQFPAPAP
ncbi:phage major capsid protein [Paracoccus onubensis]|uniref:phage major capsid protein n=1 Tax=Paracoccus onubensis TaxID=1675788 RepID=UPI001C725BBA|nr:phage major capsid protein [Paracoccus onubensis]